MFFLNYIVEVRDPHQEKSHNHLKLTLQHFRNILKNKLKKHNNFYPFFTPPSYLTLKTLKQSFEEQQEQQSFPVSNHTKKLVNSNFFQLSNQKQILYLYSLLFPLQNQPNSFMDYDFHASCSTSGCEEGCCNYYGECPSQYKQLSYSQDYTSCHYYYNTYSSQQSHMKLSIEGIVGIAVGVVTLLAMLIIGWLVYRTRKELRDNIEVTFTKTVADIFGMKLGSIPLTQYEAPTPEHPSGCGSIQAYPQDPSTSQQLIYQQDHLTPSLTSSGLDIENPQLWH